MNTQASQVAFFVYPGYMSQFSFLSFSIESVSVNERDYTFEKAKQIDFVSDRGYIQRHSLVPWS